MPLNDSSSLMNISPSILWCIYCMFFYSFIFCWWLINKLSWSSCFPLHEINLLLLHCIFNPTFWSIVIIHMKTLTSYINLLFLLNHHNLNSYFLEHLNNNLLLEHAFIHDYVDSFQYPTFHLISQWEFAWRKKSCFLLLNLIFSCVSKDSMGHSTLMNWHILTLQRLKLLYICRFDEIIYK